MTAAVTLTHPADGVALVRLDRAEEQNALTTALKSQLLDVLETVAGDEDVRAVVLTGAGSAFSVGQDLHELHHELAEDPSRAADTVEEHYNPITLLLATMPKPVVAAVNGTCVGAGLGFALACDLQVWASGATLATAFTKVGLTCDSGVSTALVRTVGQARASELMLLAAPFTVEQAIGWGFAGDVVGASEVETRALATARRLAAGPTRALAASKRLLAQASSRSLADTLRAEAAEQAALAMTLDHAAGVEAFLARKSAVFTGS